MKTVPLSEAKARLGSLLDAVGGARRGDRHHAQRAGGRGSRKPGGYSRSWKETAAVRADADLVAEIRRGLSALKHGKAKLYTLDELFAD